MPRSYLLIVSFLVGVFFRLWFISLVPQPFAFDQEQYHILAKGIVDYGLYVDSFRTYGYPLLIAIIYRLFGVDTLYWKIMQSIMDTSTAFIIFLLARKIFRSGKIALVSYLLYLVNPFTSSFTGVMLSEVFTAFLLSTIFLIFLCYLEKRKIWLVFLLALVLGYLPQVKLVYTLFSVVFVLALTIYILREKIDKNKKTLRIIATFTIFCLPFVYSLVGNWKFFKTITPFIVDNNFIMNGYISLYVDRIPFRQTSIWDFPPEVRKIYEVFSLPYKTQEERNSVAMTYFKLGLEEVRRNPGKFIVWRLTKMWYVWEKHFLFFYVGPNNTFLDLSIYWVNIAILIFAFFGFLFWYRRIVLRLEKNYLGFARLSVFLIIYISVVYIFSTTEERYSIPAYFLIFLFCGYGIWNIFPKLRRLFVTSP